MNEKEKAKRLKELESKTTLTNDEMMEKIRLSPEGRYKLLPNLRTLNPVDLDNAMKNIRETKNRIDLAINKGFYIEAISLILLSIEIWLKLYLIAKNCKTTEEIKEVYLSEFGQIKYESKKTFGVLIIECKKKGFNKELIDLLITFNQHRINAVHKYLQGVIKYESLLKVCNDFINLPNEVLKYVGNEIGITIIIKDK